MPLQDFEPLEPVKPDPRTIDFVLDHGNFFFGKFFVEALPAAALAYGLVWLVMRPKAQKIQSPALWHICGIAGTIIISGIFRIVAMITFAGRDAYEPARETGAEGFYLFLVPAIVAAGYFMWLKNHKLSAQRNAESASDQSRSTILPSMRETITARSTAAAGVALNNARAAKAVAESAPVTAAATSLTAPLQQLVVDEDAIYAAALSEIKSGAARPGLWAKAFADADGDENKAQARYIRLRLQQEQTAATALVAESARQKSDALSEVIEKLRLKGYEAKKAGADWKIQEPLGGRVKLDSDVSLLEYAQGRVDAMPSHLNGDKRRGIQTCPNCKLVNPPEARHCDCGYDFSSR